MDDKKPNSIKVTNRGGVRPGSGRKAGSTNKISAESIMASLLSHTGGIPYEELLVNDFLTARREGDTAAVLKYHQMLLNKVVADINEIKVIDASDEIESKRRAFMAALSKLTNRDDT
jgi:hypothetical protein